MTQLNLLQPTLNIVAGTGHRPDKLDIHNSGSYHPILTMRLVDLAVHYFKQNRPDRVISGMALGWDTAIALAALSLGIPLTAAVPFKGQDRLWKPYDRARYFNILKKADDVVVVCDGGYSARSMMIRNKYMVDRCTRLLALYNGEGAGGTANCVKYAVYRNVPVDNLWRSYLEFKFGY